MYSLRFPYISDFSEMACLLPPAKFHISYSPLFAVHNLKLSRNIIVSVLNSYRTVHTSCKASFRVNIITNMDRLFQIGKLHSLEFIYMKPLITLLYLNINVRVWNGCMCVDLCYSNTKIS